LALLFYSLDLQPSGVFSALFSVWFEKMNCCCYFLAPLLTPLCVSPWLALITAGGALLEFVFVDRGIEVQAVVL